MSDTHGVAEGITFPPIDDLLAKTDSKYGLVIYAAKRARQINAYYSQLGEGLLEYVGPLVETTAQEKPLSIALREIDAGLLTAEELQPGQEVDAMGVLIPQAPEIDLGDAFSDLSADLNPEAPEAPAADGPSSAQ